MVENNYGTGIQEEFGDGRRHGFVEAKPIGGAGGRFAASVQGRELLPLLSFHADLQVVAGHVKLLHRQIIPVLRA